MARRSSKDDEKEPEAGAAAPDDLPPPPDGDDKAEPDEKAEAKPRAAAKPKAEPGPEPWPESADEAPEASEMLARLRPYDKQRGCVTKDYSVEGYRFRCGDDFQAVPAAVGEYLARVKNPGPRAAPAFEVKPAQG